MLPALLLVLAAAPLAPLAPLAPTGLDGPARVELLEGRGFLAGPDGVLALERGRKPIEVAGAGHLELRPGARVALRWDAVGSLVVLGPAVLEWRPADGARALLEWRLAELCEVHVEVRRGPVRLRLPGGWTATVESGATFLRGLPGGGAELSHDAGLPLLIAAPHAPSEVRPPWVVLAGARLRLDPREPYPQAAAGSTSRLLDPFARRGVGAADGAALEPWGGFSWPWEGAALAHLGPVAGAEAQELPAEPPAEVAAPGEAPPTEPRGAHPEPPRRTHPQSGPPRPYATGGVLRLTPWGVRRFRAPGEPWPRP